MLLVHLNVFGPLHGYENTNQHVPFHVHVILFDNLLFSNNFEVWHK